MDGNQNFNGSILSYEEKDKWEEYNRRKRELQDLELHSVEYASACRQIADEMII